MTERACARCGGPIPSSRRPHALYCSEAHASQVRNRRHYGRHPDKFAAQRAAISYANRVLSRAKYRAKKIGVPFSITLADIHIPTECPILGIRLTALHGRRGNHPQSPSIDRMIPALGYVPGNVRIISARANLLKSDATPRELRAVLEDLEAIHAGI